MSFLAGRVGFLRFKVTIDIPPTADVALEKLRDHAFKGVEIGAPPETEVGWVTGSHIMDTKFDHDKNVYGPGSNILLFGMRIDTHKAPAEVVTAYRKINEAALMKDNPSGFASKLQKKEAKETAERQAQEDLAAGKFKKSKLVHIIWNLSTGVLYLGAPGDKVVTNLTHLMDATFKIVLNPITSETVARRVLDDVLVEDLRPAAFTKAPDQAGDEITVPSVPWMEKAAHLKDFLGNEFLLWLWFRIEQNQAEITTSIGDAAVVLCGAIDTQCAYGVTGKQSLRSQTPTLLPESGKALMTGKWPRRAGMLLASPDDKLHWELSLAADKWLVGSCKLPDAPDECESPRQIMEHRIVAIQKLGEFLDAMLEVYIDGREGDDWIALRRNIITWIQTRKTRVVVPDAVPDDDSGE